MTIKINEALEKRKTHYLINDYTGPEWKPAPLCNISPETLTYKQIGLYYTAIASEVTCKRCIRCLTGRYTR